MTILSLRSVLCWARTGRLLIFSQWGGETTMYFTRATATKSLSITRDGGVPPFVESPTLSPPPPHYISGLVPFRRFTAFNILQHLLSLFLIPRS